MSARTTAAERSAHLAEAKRALDAGVLTPKDRDGLVRLKMAAVVVTVTRGDGDARRTYEGKIGGVAPTGAYLDVKDRHHAGGSVRLPLDGGTRLEAVDGKRP